MWAIMMALILSGSGSVVHPQDLFTKVAVMLPLKVHQPSLSEGIVSAAKILVDKSTPYHFSYPPIAYPGGDVPVYQGLCCDVVIRALRANGIDLQELVQEDIHRSPEVYRRIVTGSIRKGLDPSVAHRRTAVLNTFFRRHAQSLTTQYGAQSESEWQAGDIVIYLRNGWETWHIAIVSDQKDERTGIPRLIDAWLKPGYVSEENLLTTHGTIGGHYRLPEDFVSRLTVDQRVRARTAWNLFLEAHNDPSVIERLVRREIKGPPTVSSSRELIPLFGTTYIR